MERAVFMREGPSTSQGSAYTGNEKTDNKAVEERIQPGADCRQALGGNCDGISRNDISLDLGG